MKKLYGSTAAKISAWVILCISMVLSLGFAVTAYLNYYEYPEDSFFSSRSLNRALASYASDAVTNWYDAEIRFRGPQNLSFAITEYKNGTSGGKPVISGSAGKADHTVTFDYCWLPDQGTAVVEAEKDPGTVSAEFIEWHAVSRAYSAGKAAVSIQLPESEEDAFWQQYRLYTLIRPFHDSCIALLCGCAALSILSLFWLFGAAGHASKDSEMHMIWLDWIPIEILAALIAGAIGILAALLQEFSWFLDGFLEMQDAGTLIALGIGAVAAFLLVLVVILSMIRRIRAKQFAATCLLCRAAVLLKVFFGMIPSVAKITAVSVVMFFLNTIAILFRARSLFHPAVVLADLLIAAGIIVYAFYTKKLKQKTALLAEGDLESSVFSEPRLAPPLYREISDDLDRISEGMKAAVEKQMRSERLKTELITNVSHDIRTPLTSIISYSDLLSKEEDPEKTKEYLDALQRNSQRLRKLSEDLIEASKASTGNIHAELTKTDAGEIISQAVGEYEEKFRGAALTPIITVHEGPVYVNADGQLLWRVLSNLLSNCVKYAQPDTRVYIDALRMPPGRVCISLKNISRDILNISADELIERFVRGDASRKGEGSGLGLNIAKSLTEVMNGSFQLTVDGDLFKAEIILDEAE